MSEEHSDKARYCHPPRAFRWKKGQSGNPRGKQPGQLPLSPRQIAENIISQTVIHDGRRITYLEIMLMQILKKASQGSKRAAKLIKRIEQYRLDTPEIWLTTPEINKQMAAEFERNLTIRSTVPEDTSLPKMTVKEAVDQYHRYLKFLEDQYDD